MIREYIERPIYIAVTIGLLIVLGLGVQALQTSCGRHHEDNAHVLEGRAKEKDAQVERLNNQVANLQMRLKDAEDAAKLHQARYQALRDQAHAPMPEKPRDLPSLAASLKDAGFTEGAAVQDSVQPSTLNRHDAELVFDLKATSDRNEICQKALDEADKNISLLREQGGIKDSIIATKDDQLAAALEGSRLRQQQAEELTKALKNEQRTRWQKYALGLGGFVLGAYVSRH
jgi:hypothetical protein